VFIYLIIYLELSVKRLWPVLKEDPNFMRHFPDELPKDRLPSRDYFFNVMNTGMNQYLQDCIKHATMQRHSAAAEGLQNETIVVSEEMMEKLNSMPHVSTKRGKTVYLLKEKAKPVAVNKKRRKIDLMQLPGLNV
jgi:hypothetical protein